MNLKNLAFYLLISTFFLMISACQNSGNQGQEEDISYINMTTKSTDHSEVDCEIAPVKPVAFTNPEMLKV